MGTYTYLFENEKIDSSNSGSLSCMVDVIILFHRVAFTRNGVTETEGTL